MKWAHSYPSRSILREKHHAANFFASILIFVTKDNIALAIFEFSLVGPFILIPVFLAYGRIFLCHIGRHFCKNMILKLL